MGKAKHPPAPAGKLRLVHSATPPKAPAEPKLDVQVNPYEFTVNDLQQLLSRYPGDAAVHIGMVCKKGRKTQVDHYPLTRIVADAVSTENDDDPDETVDSLVFLFDELVNLDEFDGPHDGNVAA